MRKDIRIRILQILEVPATVTEIKLKLRDVKSFGTIAYHLKNLEEECVIKKNKDTSKRGSPTKYSLIDKNLIEVIKKMREDSIVSKQAILKKIKEQPLIEDREISRFVEISDLPHTAVDDIFGCTNENLATLHFKITEKGEKFLKQKELQ